MKVAVLLLFMFSGTELKGTRVLGFGYDDEGVQKCHEAAAMDPVRWASPPAGGRLVLKCLEVRL